MDVRSPHPAADNPPGTVTVVMGVAGSGKTTVGRLLADRLRVPYADGDDFHPAANVARMRAGHALTDADRAPWLAALGRWIDARGATGGVVSCSGLRRAYRDALRRDRPRVRLVLLTGDPDLLARRIAGRRDHFMAPAMLAGQLATLEPPEPDEPVLQVDVAPPPAVLVARIADWLAAPVSPPAAAGTPPVRPPAR
ncbi:gluconokinase [Pilimelia terevasa]|uniref:Gluconokinase n=1 Tax=Pilimelia terevasa TaxID=53372 RepID=A0A8J3FIY6_9ACTN|nr:gluconokinase [Pilimelia terevasa]GGK34193.1 gluconokinase [Pilimelia terevasa]